MANDEALRLAGSLYGLAEKRVRLIKRNRIGRVVFGCFMVGILLGKHGAAARRGSDGDTVFSLCFA